MFLWIGLHGKTNRMPTRLGGTIRSEDADITAARIVLKRAFVLEAVVLIGIDPNGPRFLIPQNPEEPATAF